MELTKFQLPKSAYAICFTQRSGSNRLARELQRTGCLGDPKEYFDPEGEMFAHIRSLQAGNLRDYVAKLGQETASPNGVFGTKLHSSAWLWLQRSSLRNWVNRIPAFVTFRRDIVAQTVSYHVAAQTEAWTSEMEQKTAPVYDFEALLTTLRSFEENNRFWSAFALQHPGQAKFLAYEDFAANPAPCVAYIAETLKVALDPALRKSDLPELEKQATDLNIAWEARFRDDLKTRGLSAAPPTRRSCYPGAT